MAESYFIPARVECSGGRADDRCLVDQAAGGDEAAFDRIVARYHERVAGLAFRLLGWPEDIDDVVQEVFLAAYLGLGRFRGECSVATWLTTITVNKCRSRQRSRLRWWKRTSSARSAHRPDAGPPADSRLAEHEMGTRVRRVIAALPVRYREVVVLRYLEEISIERISDVLGISRNAVQVRLNRARDRLRNALQGLVEE